MGHTNWKIQVVPTYSEALFGFDDFQQVISEVAADGFQDNHGPLMWQTNSQWVKSVKYLQWSKAISIVVQDVVQGNA